jgi:hypothetical protein
MFFGLQAITGFNGGPWQSRLNPIQHVFGDGCHLNRPMDQIICAQPFQVRFIQTFYLEGTP